jgi:hypothetical protein
MAPGQGGPDGPGPRGNRGPGGGGPGAGGPGDRHLPPKLLIIQRVQAPAFEPGWFSPEAHVTTNK